MVTKVRRKLKKIARTAREVRVFAKAMRSADHPILAQVVPTRHCNLACAYCNEFDNISSPVPTEEMFRRIDRLSELGTTIISLSGGEPTLHPDLDLIIRRIREKGIIATLITNGLLLTPDRIRRLNRAGLDYLQISIDNLAPDETSKKSLRALGGRLEWLAAHAEFEVSVNSVVGSGIRNPEDAFQIALRARRLAFTNTIGIIHDHGGQVRALEASHLRVVERILRLSNSMFSFAHFDQFQENIARGLPNGWHCRAGGRFLYICEDGLVHYCSQQRGRPGIALQRYSEQDLENEAGRPKPCAPMCTISCVHQTAMLDSFREQPRRTLAGILERRKRREPGFHPPTTVRFLTWMFLESQWRGAFAKIVLNLLGLRDGSR